ncbi:hypothetical protein L1987_64957 [Smallanthus sonchifolius]|uniref:Uncharacterized protein n=1 Tax=Smallanthus sonchifolius TaxID=185202 RepID=A0ACB9BT20_9ASTR|nr:hypothetical protein L1987_64957 [Smallanthus sonchifolius]
MSLESELNRCISDNFSLKSDLNALTERAVKSEIESGVTSRFVEIQVVEMAEVYRRERVAMVVKIGGLEKELNLVMEKKSQQ